MPYKVQLDIFEGPLDLLLFFISRDEIDIYDIPIARITDQYLAYLDLMQQLNVSVAGEYIRMAATLMHIKARTLLPQLSENEEDEEVEDPRSELVEMLLEYKRFKEAAENLETFESEQSQYYPRQPSLAEIDTEVNPEELLREVTLFDLMKTFRNLLQQVPETPTHNVSRIDTSVEEQRTYILEKLHTRSSLQFSELIESFAEKITVIITFIALLDMMKDRVVRVVQSGNFDDILIKKQPESVETAT